MKTDHNMDFENCCSTLKDTLYSLKNAVGNASPISQPSSISFKPQNGQSKNTHQRSSSEEMSIEEDINGFVSPFRKYKCFKCFGVNSPKNANFSLPLCEQCDGAQYISDSHPLSALLEKVIALKLPSLPARETAQVSSYTIIDNPPECHNCKKLIQSEEFFSCDSCPQYIICQTCYSNKRNIHPGHRFQRKASHSLLKLKQNLPTMKKISEQLESQEGCTLDEQYWLCSNCGEDIEQCYEVCLDCELEGIQYRLCNTCSDISKICHPNHNFTVRTSSKESKLPGLLTKHSNRSSVTNICQSIEEGLNKEVSKTKKGLRSQSIVFIPQMDLQSSCQLLEYSPSSQRVSPPPRIGQTERFFLDENHSFNPESFEESLVLHPKKEPANREIKGEDSRIRNESMVKINMEESEDHSLNYVTHDFRLVTSQFEDEEQVDSVHEQILTPAQSKLTQTYKDEYIFNEYQCDICGAHPIKNKRYHCKECPNFDICEECFKQRDHQHLHKDYEQIDGKELLKQKELRLSKVICDLHRYSLGSIRSIGRKSIQQS